MRQRRYKSWQREIVNARKYHALAIATALLILLACRPAGAQTLDNIRSEFDQSSQLMHIRYDLKGLNYKKEIQVKPYLVWDDGSQTPLKNLSGDFGWLNRGGRNKLILWAPLHDGLDSLTGAHVRIETQVRPAAIPRFRALALHGSNSAPIGLKAMQLGRAGFYAAARMGKLPPSYRYNVSDAGEMDYRESGVYEITGGRRLAGFALTIGQILQLGRNIYGYAGLGYGVEQLFWEYEAFNLEKTSLGKFWALNENINRKGLVLEGGVLLRRGRLLLDLGVGAVQLKSVQLAAGVGWAFSTNSKGQSQ